MIRQAWRCGAAAVLSAAAAVGSAPAGAQTYAIDYIASASSGHAMDRLGRVVVGTTTLPPVCGGCPPSFDIPAIWAGGRRQLLAVPDGAAYLDFAGINAQGWIAGSAMRLDATGGAGYVWVPRPDGSGHDPQPIGQLAGFEDAMPAGIDDDGRVFGLARTWFVAQDPFVWDPAEGLRSLSALGYPAEAPAAVSPAGVVATPTLTYRFGDPASVQAVAPAPDGYKLNLSTPGGAVNDAGVRAGFLIGTTSSAPRFLARYSDAGGWQVLAGPVSASTRYDVGTIDIGGTLTARLINTGYVAFGPDGGAQALTGLMSAAYREPTVVDAGSRADDGRILASVTVGRSTRLAQLVPVQPCGAGCMTVATLTVSGRMVSAPGQPGQCVDGARNDVTARLTVLDDAGQPVPGATVRGRFLDDEFLDQPVTLKTSRRGSAVARHSGAACVGAVAFLVDGVDKAGLTLDRTRGQLSEYVIPQPR